VLVGVLPQRKGPGRMVPTGAVYLPCVSVRFVANHLEAARNNGGDSQRKSVWVGMVAVRFSEAA
jgi:hypothetical protein